MTNRRDFLAGGAAAAAAFALGAAPLQAKPQPKPFFATADDAHPIHPAGPGVVAPDYRRTVVAYANNLPPGSIVVDANNRYLYLKIEGDHAIRYGVCVGKDGFLWSGNAKIMRKVMWPKWTPPKDMVARDPTLAKHAGGMPGGPQNPLGARALYLFEGNRDTLYRIHGTNKPASIGKFESSGCIRMLNEDVAELYGRTPIGTEVYVFAKKA